MSLMRPPMFAGPMLRHSRRSKDFISVEASSGFAGAGLVCGVAVCCCAHAARDKQNNAAHASAARASRQAFCDMGSAPLRLLRVRRGRRAYQNAPPRLTTRAGRETTRRALMPKNLSKLIFVVFSLTLLASCAGVAEQPRTPAGWRGVVSTLAGSGAPGYSAVAARQTRFAAPFGVPAAADGSVDLTDAGEANRIRKGSPEGVVTTLAGGREGFADGAGAAASFNTPSALALDAAGNLYVADTGNNRVRKVTPEGAVTTLAGDGGSGFVDGPAS